jgi:hypothetical protein
MSTPTTAWLRRVSLACACGMTSAALGQTPQPFSPPPNPSPIAGPSTGQASVTFRTTAPQPTRAPAANTAAPAPQQLPPGSQYAQPAYYQAAPGANQYADQQTTFATAGGLVQRYDQFVQQLPPGQTATPPVAQTAPAAAPAPAATTAPLSPYPMERGSLITPVSMQGDPAPAPVDVEAPGTAQPLDTDSTLSQGTVRDPIVTHADAAACDTCGSDCNSCKCKTGPSGFFWVRGDYLLWWTKGSYVPPLITTSPDGTPISQTGVLGQPNTTVLFGDNDINDGDRSGVRFRAGYWFDCCMCAGIEAEWLQLGSETTSYDAFCPPNGYLARPFFNVQLGQQDAELVCYPGVVNGSVHVNADSDFYSGGIRYLRNICAREWCIPGDGCGTPGVQGAYRLNWLAGYRYLNLDEGLTINEMLVSTNSGGVIPLGTTFDLTDDFQTESEFHGVDIGLAAQWRRGRWTLDLLGKAALGNTTNTVSINGSTTTMIPNGPTNTGVGGLLAQATNIGTYEEDEFSVVPELGVNVGYNITPRLRALVGYSFLYWTNVVRPGDQIDLSLNPSQFPPGTLNGEPRPSFSFNDSDFWAQGLNFGAEYRF